jgi:hypothetical protein
MEQLQGKLCRMCRGKIIIIELPDKEPDGSITTVCGIDSIGQGQKNVEGHG